MTVSVRKPLHRMELVMIVTLKLIMSVTQWILYFNLL